MIGIKDIGVYIPSERIDNMNKSYNGQPVDKAFIKDKVGFVSLARMADSENTVELCLKALENLQQRLPDFNVSSVDFLCVCTQNGEYQLPHTSAILHGKLNLSPHCSTFDLNLGCSGYIYSLDVARHFMEGNDLKTGLLFTCDPYSKIVSPDDKSTDLIFGDAATVTLLTTDGAWKIGKPQYLTKGSDASALIKKNDAPLFMDGRKIFNFVMRDGVAVIRKCLEKNNLSAEDVDRFLFHQASLYVVKNLAHQLKLPPEKVPFEAQEYGNTVSSSIPILLKALCPPIWIQMHFPMRIRRRLVGIGSVNLPIVRISASFYGAVASGCHLPPCQFLGGNFMAIDYMNAFKEAMKNTTLELNLDKLDPDKDLSAQGVDSMDTINLLFAIGDYFHVDIIDSVGIEDLNTLNKIIALLQKHDAKEESA